MDTANDILKFEEIQSLKDEKLTETIQSETDTAWKNILQKYLKEFLELCWLEAHESIDWSKSYEFLEQEMMAIHSSKKKNRRVVDKLIKVYLKNGREKWILIHIEIQGEWEKDFNERMFIYYYRIFDRYQVNIASIAIFIDPNKKWKPCEYKSEIWGCSVNMKFPILKILDFKDHETTLKESNNPFATIILAQLKAIEAKGNAKKTLANKKEIAKMLYKKGYSKEEIIHIGLFLDGIFAMPKADRLEYTKFIGAIEKEKKVSYLSCMEEFGLEQGLEQGREQGIEIGMKKGEKNILCRLLELKFQILPQKYQDQIDSASPEQLLQWAEKILFCNTLEQIFKTDC